MRIHKVTQQWLSTKSEVTQLLAIIKMAISIRELTVLLLVKIRNKKMIKLQIELYLIIGYPMKIMKMNKVKMSLEKVYLTGILNKASQDSQICLRKWWKSKIVSINKSNICNLNKLTNKKKRLQRKLLIKIFKRYKIILDKRVNNRVTKHQLWIIRITIRIYDHRFSVPIHLHLKTPIIH